MGRSKGRATYEDLERLPDHVVGELIDGELVVTPRPAAPHALATSAIGADLVGPFQKGRGGPGGWWILDEPELHLGADVLVPDLAGWRRERLPSIPDAPAFELPPDWICEVVSPRTARIDRTRKSAVYAAAGVEWMWLVDPLARTLEVLRLEGGRWTQRGAHGGDGAVRAEPFGEIELELGSWWVGPTPDEP
jgi:Uma2 family endonuclease